LVRESDRNARETHSVKLVYPAATYRLWLAITEVKRTPLSIISPPKPASKRKCG